MLLYSGVWYGTVWQYGMVRYGSMLWYGMAVQYAPWVSIRAQETLLRGKVKVTLAEYSRVHHGAVWNIVRCTMVQYGI